MVPSVGAVSHNIVWDNLPKLIYGDIMIPDFMEVRILSSHCLVLATHMAVSVGSGVDLVVFQAGLWVSNVATTTFPIFPAAAKIYSDLKKAKQSIFLGGKLGSCWNF